MELLLHFSAIIDCQTKKSVFCLRGVKVNFCSFNALTNSSISFFDEVVDACSVSWTCDGELLGLVWCNIADAVDL